MTQTLTVKMPSPAWQAVKNLGWIVAVRAVRIGRAIKHRHQAMALAGFDDRSLADIGLTRSDLRDAYAEPFWRDPTSILVKRATERHVYRRKSAIGLAGGPFGAPPLAPENGYRAPATNRPARYTL